MKAYRDEHTGKFVVEVGDISYLKERNHKYNWFQVHWNHHRLRYYLKKADVIIVKDAETAFDVFRYYFIPKDRITVVPQNQE